MIPLRFIRLWFRAFRMARRPIPWLHLIRLVFSKRAPRALWRKRMHTCMHCAIYDLDNHRCATRFGFTDLGCECSMPMKALFQDSTCWARDNGLPYGWEE